MRVFSLIEYALISTMPSQLKIVLDILLKKYSESPWKILLNLLFEDEFLFFFFQRAKAHLKPYLDNSEMLPNNATGFLV